MALFTFVLLQYFFPDFFSVKLQYNFSNGTPAFVRCSGLALLWLLDSPNLAAAHAFLLCVMHYLSYMRLFLCYIVHTCYVIFNKSPTVDVFSCGNR
jgi:hypothetical protein